jgi:hypothetical protein
MLRGGADEEEDEDRRSRLVKRSDALGDFARAISVLST